MSNLKPVLNVKNVCRLFGDESVLDGINLQISQGEIKALLGPNGAGKTTLSKICSGVLSPTAGEIEIVGINLLKNLKQAQANLSLVTGGDYGFYNRATAYDNLLFFADLQGVPSAMRRAKVVEVLGKVKLQDSSHKKVSEFSRGMKQRLHLARGMLTNPKLLILDEITSGLDPDIARDIRALIREIANQGTAVLLTTHLLTEVQELADSVDLLVCGKIRFTGSVTDLIAATKITAVTEIEVPGFKETDYQLLQKTGLQEIACVPNASGYKVTGYWLDKPSQIESQIPNARYVITRPPTIEEAYLALVARLNSADSTYLEAGDAGA